VPDHILATTSLNSHVICTDPQLLIEERPEAYKSIRAVPPDVEEKRIAEGVCMLKPFVT
jgi:release factor H-coupled RctB family protein